MSFKKMLFTMIFVLSAVPLASCGPAPTLEAAQATATPQEIESTETQPQPVAEAAESVEQILHTGLDVGPGGDEDGRPWTGGAGHTTHIKQFVTPTIYNKDLTDIIPYGVESWEANDDFTVWTYHLREDIKWSDGEPLTANDWKFTAEFVTMPDFETDQIANVELAFHTVAGFETKRSGEVDELEGVQVIDDYTIQYTLSTPDPRHFASQYRLYILPEHAIDFPAAEWSSNDWIRDPERMVGSGPFVVSDYKAGEYLTLEKNPYYFEGEPKLDKLVIRFFSGDQTASVLALVAGQIDFTYIDASELLNFRDKYNIFSNSSGVVVFSHINYNNVPELWQDIRVRQAIMYAIDQEAITSIILDGTHIPIPCPIPYPDLWPEDINWYGYSPDKAKELLAEAGVNPADISVEWIGHANYATTHNDAALQAVQNYLAEIGITNFTYDFIEVPVFRDRYTPDGGWGMNYRGLAVPLYGHNLGRVWSNSGGQGGDNSGYDFAATGFEDAIEKIQMAPTTEEYFAALSDFCELHNEKLPDLQLWVGNRYGAASKMIEDFWWQPAGAGGPYYDQAHLWKISKE